MQSHFLDQSNIKEVSTDKIIRISSLHSLIFKVKTNLFKNKFLSTKNDYSLVPLIIL
jgi:hypothetical protein